MMHIHNMNDMDLTDGMPEDTEENGYPRTEQRGDATVEMESTIVNAFNMADKHLELAAQENGDRIFHMSIAKLYLERISASSAERQAAALERIAAVLESTRGMYGGVPFMRTSDSLGDDAPQMGD